MRLTELDPNWVSHEGRVVGIAFQCPVHRGECPHERESGYMGVYFANPPDGGPPLEGGGARWQRTGETFEALTVHPSIRVSYEAGKEHWHGFITNGEVTTC